MASTVLMVLVFLQPAAAIPGVSVRIVHEDHEETGVAIETGRYRVETMLDGFAPSIRRNVILQVSQTVAVDHGFAGQPTGRPL